MGTSQTLYSPTTNEFESLGEKPGKVEVFDSILEKKTTNARVDMVLNKYKVNYTGRQGKHRTDGTLHRALNAKTRMTEVKGWVSVAGGQLPGMTPDSGEDNGD
jgi:hypothetical protein